MVKPEYTVIGDWVIDNSNGYIRHKVCRRWCGAWNSIKGSIHICGSSIYEDEDLNPGDWYDIYNSEAKIEIPLFVQLISEAMRKK